MLPHGQVSRLKGFKSSGHTGGGSTFNQSDFGWPHVVSQVHFSTSPATKQTSKSKFTCLKMVPTNNSISDDNKIKVNIFQCEKCCYKTNRKSNYDRHNKAMHDDVIKELECCDIKFANKALLKEHSKSVHVDGYQCAHCNRTFSRKALLKRHKSVHDGIKEFICSKCTYATSHKSNLDRHCLKIHKMEVIGSKDKIKKQRIIKQQNGKSQSNSSLELSLSNSYSQSEISSEIENHLSYSHETITSSQESLINKFNNAKIYDVAIRDSKDLFSESCLIMNDHLLIHHEEVITDNHIGTDDDDDDEDDDDDDKDDDDSDDDSDDGKADNDNDKSNNRIRLCPQPYKCPTCQKSFKSQIDFSKHSIQVHNQTPDAQDPEVLNAAKVLTEFKQPSPIKASYYLLKIINQ